MKSYRTLALKELLSQKVTSILILIADECRSASRTGTG